MPDYKLTPAPVPSRARWWKAPRSSLQILPRLRCHEKRRVFASEYQRKPDTIYKRDSRRRCANTRIQGIEWSHVVAMRST